MFKRKVFRHNGNLVTASGILPVFKKHGKINILFQKERNKLSDFGGKVEFSDRNPWQTAIRELIEEVGFEGSIPRLERILKRSVIGCVYYNRYLLYVVNVFPWFKSLLTNSANYTLDLIAVTQSRIQCSNLHPRLSQKGMITQITEIIQLKV